MHNFIISVGINYILLSTRFLLRRRHLVILILFVLTFVLPLLILIRLHHRLFVVFFLFFVLFSFLRPCYVRCYQSQVFLCPMELT